MLGGDVEELCVDIPFIGETCTSDPDLLIKIYDSNGNLVYQTGGIGSNEYITGTTASWSNIDFSLNNPPYSVSIWDTENWDELDFGVQFSDDDLLGTFTLNLEDGEHSFSSDCSSGTYSISSETINVQSFSDSETVTVFEQPDLVTLLNEDLYVVYIDYEDVISYQWFFNNQIIDGANDSTYLVEESGSYYVEITTEYGCVSVSLPIDVVKCDSEFTPSIFVSDFTLLTTDTDYDIDWFFNGLDYGSGPTIDVGSDGYYWLIASDEFGCSWNSDTIFFQSPVIDDIDNDGILNDVDDDVDGDGIVNSEDDDVDGDGIPDNLDDDIDGDGICDEDDDTISGYLFLEEISESSLLVFPNPSNGVFTINLDSSLSHLAKIKIRDLSGAIVFTKDVELNRTAILDLSYLPSSVYLLNLQIDRKNIYKRLVIN